MFFLGLLSTPLPYLLLAAFYFFGFAMGMFNNKTGDELTETIVSVTIPAEVKQKTSDQSAYYFQVNNREIQSQAQILKPENTVSAYIPDTGPATFKVWNINVIQTHLPAFLFSRPPPSVC